MSEQKVLQVDRAPQMFVTRDTRGDREGNGVALAEPEQSHRIVCKVLAAIRGDYNLRMLARVLAALSGTSYNEYDANRRMVQDVNAVVRALQVRLQLRATGELVSIRCVNPPRSKRGSFQARSADRSQRTLYSGDVFPDLAVVEATQR